MEVDAETRAGDEADCCVCLETFKSWKLQNPSYCCTALLCSDCHGNLESCPQCREPYSASRGQGYSLKTEIEHFVVKSNPDSVFINPGVTMDWNSDESRKTRHYLDLPYLAIYDTDGSPRRLTWSEDRISGGPTFMSFHGNAAVAQWFKNDLHHNASGPAYIKSVEGKLEAKIYYLDGFKHSPNPDVPASTFVLPTHTSEDYYKNGVLHRDGDKPAAVIKTSCVVLNERWYKGGRLFRELGLPAMIEYFSNGIKKVEYFYHDDGKLKKTLSYDIDGHLVPDNTIHKGHYGQAQAASYLLPFPSTFVQIPSSPHSAPMREIVVVDPEGATYHLYE